LIAKEGEMSRKNLNDVIHGDRTISRGGRVLNSLGDDMYGSSYFNQGGSIFSGSSKKDKHDDFGGGFARCYESHPALKLPGTELVVYGGSCSSPVVKDADVYIGFELGMRFTERNWPWKKGAEVLFRITDMCAPEKPDEFKKLVAWAKKQLEAGLKVHAGCIGGHGRTGTFLAALVSEFGEKDAIAYVRQHYCKKAVESSVQAKFLKEHFGITPHDGYKSSSSTSSKSTNSKSSGYKSSSSKTTTQQTSPERFPPVGGNGCIWG
jgi:hypothetical protein